MATSTSFTGDGSTRAYNIDFEFADPETIRVEVDEVEVSFSWTGASQVTLDVAPAVGSRVRIFRRTSVDEPEVLFQDTQVLVASKLNAALKQTLDSDQEQWDELEGLSKSAIRVPQGDVLDSLPTSAERSGKSLWFDEAGQPVARSVSEAAALFGVSPASNIITGLNGVDDVAIIQRAYENAEPGDTLVFPAGGTSTIDSLLTLNVPGVRTIAYGHTFRITGNGAGLKFVGPISDVLPLSVDYVKGSRILTVSHTGTQLDNFVRNSRIKILSDARDGWHLNNGSTNPLQYRLAEEALVRKVVDNGDGTANIELWSPLMFVRGFNYIDDVENLTEVDAYTPANGARIFAFLSDTFEWEGGTFMVPDYGDHVDTTANGGWRSMGLFEVYGYNRPKINNVRIGPGTERGLMLAGCPDFEVNSLQVRGLPDFAEIQANGGLNTAYLGYGIQVSGCGGGVINNLRARDTRHAVTESSHAAPAGGTGDYLFHQGRSYGVRVNSPTVEGQFSAAVDTHHGAHAWIISNATVLGTQSEPAISLRGPDHQVIGGQLTAAQGINVFTENQNDGGTDVGSLNGNGNKWMSSARIIGPHINCSYRAFAAVHSRIIVEGGARIRCRSHNLVRNLGGVIEFSSGTIEAEITGEAQASSITGSGTSGIIHFGDADPAAGVTWTPEVVIRQGARLAITAAAANDAYTMEVFGQSGTAGRVRIFGSLSVELPAVGFSSSVFGPMPWLIDDQSGSLAITGDPTIESLLPPWNRGKVRIGPLSQSAVKALFSFQDTTGGPDTFVGTVRLFLVDHSSPTMAVAEFQIYDGFTGGSTSEAALLLSGNTTDFEANNSDPATTPPTAGKIGLSFRDGQALIRHEKAGTTYEDVFAEFTIHRQPRGT